MLVSVMIVLEIGTKARMRVQEYYAIDNYVNQLVSYYEKLRKED